MMHLRPQMLVIALMIAGGAVVIEALLSAKAGRRYAWGEAKASLLVAIVHRFITIATAFFLLPALDRLWPYRLMNLSTPTWVFYIVGFMLVEFCYYWMHRWSHHIPLMWATHSVHHSAEQLNFTNAIRLGATGFFSLEWLPFVPLIFLGFSPHFIIDLLGLNIAYQFFLHTEMIPKLNILEHVLNTPSHHRVHHARNKEYLNKNFGGVLIIFDRLFGTYADERDDRKPIYGLWGERRGNNFLQILFQGWVTVIKHPTDALRPFSMKNRLSDQPRSSPK